MKRCVSAMLLLGREIPEQPGERRLIAVVVLPAAEVANVAAAKRRGPAARRVEYGVVEPDRKQHRAALLDLPVQRRADLEIDPAAGHGGLRQDDEQLVIDPNRLVDAAHDGCADLQVIWLGVSLVRSRACFRSKAGITISQFFKRYLVGMFKNGVHDACEGCRGINDDCVLGKPRFCRMLESRKGFPFTCRSSPLVFRSGGKTPIQRIQIDLKHKHGIEQTDEAVSIPGTAAKECCGMVVIGHQSLDLLNVPYPSTMLVSVPFHQLPSLEIVPIGQLPVAVDGVIAAPLQLVADRRFPGAGNAVD
jgi:hypothetical protein